MISFNYETEFELANEAQISEWLSNVILSENKKEGDVNYIFCDDAYLLERLNPDTIDFHLPRPGFEPKNFDIIMQVLKYHYPLENFDWLVSYCEQYKSLL